MISVSSVVVVFLFAIIEFSQEDISRGRLTSMAGVIGCNFFRFYHIQNVTYIFGFADLLYSKDFFTVLAIMVNILVIIGGSGGRWRRYWLLLTIILLLHILNILNILNILDILNILNILKILNILNILKLKVDRLPKFNRYKNVTVLIESCRAFWTRVWSNWGVQRVCLVGR